MIEELTPVIRGIIEKSQRMISGHFQTSLHVDNVTQLSGPDRRNLILRLNVNNLWKALCWAFPGKKEIDWRVINEVLTDEKRWR